MVEPWAESFGEAKKEGPKILLFRATGSPDSRSEATLRVTASLIKRPSLRSTYWAPPCMTLSYRYLISFCTLFVSMAGQGCAAGPLSQEGESGEESSSGASSGSASSGETGGETGETTTTGSTGGETGGPAPSVLPARIRRLSNAEYDASLQDLFSSQVVASVEFGFPPDARQGPSNAPAGPAFSVNEAQRVDPVFAEKLETAAVAFVQEARQNGTMDQLAPCDGGAEEECAAAFVRSFGAQAYRRPVSDEELADLVSGEESPFHVASDGGSYEEAIDHVAVTLLQMPSFLYHTELGGQGPGAGDVELTADEVADAMAYLFTSHPPDADLLAAAASGDLLTPEGRESQARRLLSTAHGRERTVNVILEWLGISDVSRREKAQTLYPEYPELSHLMEKESRAFVNEVLANSTGTLGELLTADWTIAEPALAQMYGAQAAGDDGRVSLQGTGRLGILNQGAFLSVFATNNGSHPVFRGVAVMRRVACVDTPDPGALGLVVTLPPTDDQATTRERFAQHSKDDACRNCHDAIDPFGFTMESFDAIGRARETENGKNIDTAVEIALGRDFDGQFANSQEMIQALANSEKVKSCLASQLVRSSIGRSGKSAEGIEDAFLEEWKQLPESSQDHFEEILVAFAKSPLFVRRNAL